MDYSVLSSFLWIPLDFQVVWKYLEDFLQKICIKLVLASHSLT